MGGARCVSCRSGGQKSNIGVVIGLGGHGCCNQLRVVTGGLGTVNEAEVGHESRWAAEHGPLVHKAIPKREAGVAVVRAVEKMADAVWLATSRAFVVERFADLECIVSRQGAMAST